MGEGSANPTDPYHTPIIIQPSTSQPQKTKQYKKPRRKVTEVPQPSDLTSVLDEAVNEEMDDSLERAATTTTSLVTEHDRGKISKTQSKATPNELGSQGTSSGGGPRVLDLETTKTTQALEIDSLKMRVKKLKRRKRSRTHGLKRLYKVGLSARVESSEDKGLGEEDASKHGRIADIDGNEVIILVSTHDEQMFDADQDLGGEEKMFDTAFKRVNTIVDYKTKLVKESSKKNEAEMIEGSSKRAGTKLEQENAKKQKIDDDNEIAELTQLVNIKPDKEMVVIDAIRLAVKPPSIIGWKIHKEGKKTYYQIIKAARSSKIYLIFSHRLKDFVREYVETLWTLVKAKLRNLRSIVIEINSRGYNQQGMLELVKVKCIFLGYYKSILGNKVWRLDDVTSKVLVQCRCCRELSLRWNHRRIIHLRWNLMGLSIIYREYINETAFAVAVVEKIYAHESLTFNNTVSFEVISKWKDGLKDDMDAQSDVYMLSNSCRKCSDDSNGHYYGYTPGHSILSLEGGLSGVYDVEKNGKWSCIYAVRYQEYQMVCTRLDIASTDVGSLKANLQHMEGLSITEVGYMTFTKAWKKEIWLKRLLIESRYELKLVAGIATDALVKGGSWSEVPAQVEVVAYRY
nr:zinc finger, CCHC-type [Tanacetum cinerariifolium]